MRRRALAAAAGLTAASPVLVGGCAFVACALIATMLGRDLATATGSWFATAARAAADHSPTGAFEATAASAWTARVLALALPPSCVLAVAAIAAHLAQTRALWRPRRRIERAPVVPPHPGRDAIVGIAAMVSVALVALAWLWLGAPRLAALVTAPTAAGVAIAAALATFACAWIALGVVDGLVRHADLATALHMTASERREDERIASADPRWRRHRADVAQLERRARTRAARSSRDLAPRSAEVAGSVLVVVDDDIAIAIAWDPVHRPAPQRAAVGRGRDAAAVVALARHHGVPLRRDPDLAAALAGPPGPLPESLWPRLATAIASVSRW